MRIGLYSHRLAEAEVIGVGRYVRELVAALAQAVDGDQLVLSSAPEPRTPSWVPAPVHSSVLPWPRKAVHAAWLAGVGPRLERSVGRLDVVHQLYPFPPIRAVAPQVVTVHDVMPFEHPEWYPRSQEAIYRRSVGLAIRRARRIVVPSKWVANRAADTLDADPSRIAVVPHGVSGTYEVDGSPEDRAAECARLGVQPGRFVVCVGVVTPRKNLIPLIRAMSELADPSFPLVIVGADGYAPGATDAELARLGNGGRAWRAGYLDDRLTAALVSSAAVLVHPALEEGFGLVPLEAMAVGTPVIAARVSSIPEVVGDAAVLVDEPTDVSSWATALAGLLESEERRSALAAAGPKRAAMFSWQRAAKSMLDIYSDAAHA